MLRMGGLSVRRNLGAFLGRANRRNYGSVVADSAARGPVAVVVAVVVCSDVWDDRDLVVDRIPPMARGKPTTKFKLTHYPISIAFCTVSAWRFSPFGPLGLNRLSVRLCL